MPGAGIGGWSEARLGMGRSAMLANTRVRNLLLGALAVGCLGSLPLAARAQAGTDAAAAEDGSQTTPAGTAGAQADVPEDDSEPTVESAGGTAALQGSPTAAADRQHRERLQAVYGAVARFSTVKVSVVGGLVQLRGEVATLADAEAAAEIAKGLPGVVYVDNQLSPPITVADRLAPLRKRLKGWCLEALLAAPLIGLALLAVVGLWALGRFVSRRDRLYERLFKAPLLRGVARRLTVIGFVLVGVLTALELLGATAIVGSILGAAGVFGLAVGFAFRDIVENYLASFLLIGRRPFALGDEIQIDTHVGMVMRLTMRETVLMTFDGNHLSLPNAVVFKATILNFTRNPRRRFEFVMGVGAAADLLLVQRIGIATLQSTPGVQAEPASTAQIEALGDSNVQVRYFGWVDQRAADYFKTRSEALRRVKVALEAAGVDLPEPIYRLQLQRPLGGLLQAELDGDSGDMRDGGRVQAPPAPVQGAEPASPQGSSPQAEEAVDVSPDTTIEREIAAEAAVEENLLHSGSRARSRPTR